MTFDATESSQSSGSAIELYAFSTGSETYRFCSGEDAVTIGEDVYEPAAIARDEVRIAGNSSSESLTVTVPHDNDFAALFVENPPGQTTTLTILRLHRTDGDAETALIFKGAVRTVGFDRDGYQANIQVLPLTGLFTKSAPRSTFQATCNNFLFDARCTVGRGPFTHTNTISAISTDRRTLTITGLTTFIGTLGIPTTAMVGGIVKAGDNYRMIQTQNAAASQVSLLSAFPSSVDVGTQVDALPGCQRTPEVCHRRFDNFDNFRGFVYVTVSNPFSEGLR